jgi:glycosyltransferase involved in cell wall biosynthesis
LPADATQAGPVSGKKIAVLCHFGWGMYRYRLDLLRSLVASGYDVTAIADWSDGDYEPMIRAQGVHTESISLTRAHLDPFADLRTLLRLIGLYRRLKPQIAQHFNTRTMILGAIAARLTGVPRIVNCVNGIGIVMGGTMRAWRWLFLPLYWVAFGGRVQAVFQNSSDQDRMIAEHIVSRARTFHIPGSGVDTDALKPDPAIAPASRDVVVMASRMVWSKGVREFVGAAEILKPRFPNIRFILAGGLSGAYGMNNPDDVDEDWVKAAVARGAVEAPGHVVPATLEGLYRRAAAVVLPSFYPEGVPRCLIEGAAAGAPIVTTDTPGCRDIVRDGISGRLCQSHSAEKLAEAIGDILATPGAVERMGAESRRLAVDVFDSRKVSAAFERIYAGKTGISP